MRIAAPYRVVIYQTKDHKQPYQDWFDDLDSVTQATIDARIARARCGNLGDSRAVDGVLELRIHAGPGHRVYYAYCGLDLILLLAGGSKRTQKKDIKKAKSFLEDFKERSK